ncbi:MAG: hypothetical protein NTY09_12225 [bacterium]|nr:hypothetical protein [bacterium]
MKRLALIFTLAILAGALMVPAVNAQSNLTNLNNIPVTDTLAAGTFEWDVWAAYNKDFQRGRRIGNRLFGSLYDNLEFGMKWGISRTAGPLELALKYKIIDEYEGRFPVSLEDNSLFGGFKYWINDDLQFNADYMGYSSNEWYLLTGGFNYDWINHIGFQGWVERDSRSEENIFVLEMAVRADMRDLTAEVSDPE